MNKLTILLPLIFLSGCGNDVRDCSDSKVKDDLMVIMNRAYGKDISDKMDVEILNIKMLSHQEDVKTNVCEADLSVSYKDEAGQDQTIKTDFVYKLSFLEDKKDTEVEADVSKIIDLFRRAILNRGCMDSNSRLNLDCV